MAKNVSPLNESSKESIAGVALAAFTAEAILLAVRGPHPSDIIPLFFGTAGTLLAGKKGFKDLYHVVSNEVQQAYNYFKPR